MTIELVIFRKSKFAGTDTLLHHLIKQAIAFILGVEGIKTLVWCAWKSGSVPFGLPPERVKMCTYDCAVNAVALLN